MKHITTIIGIFALVLAGCESEEDRVKRTEKFVAERLAIVESGGFTHPIQHPAGFYASKEDRVFSLSFADGTANLVRLEEVKKR